MRRLALFLLALPLLAVNVYVSSAGNDSNTYVQAQSTATPWFTLTHAYASVACGDVINIIVNGVAVAGDGTLPGGTTLDANGKPWGTCGPNTTIQSANISQFQPAGYRTNPTNDAGKYGKVKLTAPIIAVPKVWTAHQFQLQSAVSVDVATSTFTLISGYPILGLQNGWQVQLNAVSAAANYGQNTFVTIVPPGGFTLATHYYVVNCSMSPACGAANSTFQLAATSGGSPITATTCDVGCIKTVIATPTGACTTGQMAYKVSGSEFSDCSANICGATWCVHSASFAFSQVAIVGARVDVAANTVTIAVNWGSGSLANDMPVTFSAVDIQKLGTLPSPLVQDQVYYVTNLSGSTFKPALTPGGTPVTLTTVGIGATMMSSADGAHNWIFRGLEIAPDGVNIPYSLLQLGSGAETSINGMAHDFEVDRCYLHDNPPTNGLIRDIAENARAVSVHDSWIIGANVTESQAIAGWSSPGPTAIVNNFIEGATENILYGGASPYQPYPNANKTFIGNFFFKPPTWRITQSTGAASGACLYDATTDPTHAGGEWYRDTMAAQNYRCGSNSQWATTGSALPAYNGMSFKDMLEHKGGDHWLILGNVFNGSYADGQSGEVFNLSQENDSGPVATTDHDTVMYNVAFNSLQFDTRASQCGAAPTNLDCPRGPGNEIRRHNLMIVNPLACGTSFAHGLCGYTSRQSIYGINAVAGTMQGDIWDHNTFWIDDSSWLSGPSPMFLTPPCNGACSWSPTMNLTAYTNNIVFGNFLGESASVSTVIPLYFTNSTFDRNVLFGGSAHTPGTGNTWTRFNYPTMNSQIGYANATGGYGGAADYHLSSSSPYSAANMSFTQLDPDGQDLGADIDQINLATSGAAAGTPPWDQMYNVHWSVIGSTKAVLAYTAPTSAACTATIYNTAVRNLAGGGNVIATVLDSAASSISDGTRREILITGLTASTQYWWKLSCAGGVLILDPNGFKTRAAGGTLQFPFQMSSATALTYSSNKDLSAGTTLSAAATQYVPVATNATIYSQFSGGQLHVSVAP